MYVPSFKYPIFVQMVMSCLDVIQVTYASIQKVERRPVTAEGFVVAIESRAMAYFRLILPTEREASSVFNLLQKLMNISMFYPKSR